MFRSIRALKEAGVLAINKRNADFTLKYNPRRLYPLVDDKLETKKLAMTNSINVPELYGVLESEGQVRRLPEIIKDRGDFVVKPAHGSGGEGILVISGRMNGKYRKADGMIISEPELFHHCYNTISGLYSLGGQPDKALIEYRVEFHPFFKEISYRGVPDIRIIVFLGIPVMSMIRLPTRMSDGKANLHQGAIGVGIDIAQGRTVAAVWGNESILVHPDTDQPVTGITIPLWNELLELATRCYGLTELGYLGVDIVLDRDKGPLILEMNARPGLNIQIANREGLLKRLELVEKTAENLKTIEERIDFARRNFKSKVAPGLDQVDVQRPGENP
jgi:alpha-L-glutamate ligase-like protein